MFVGCAGSGAARRVTAVLLLMVLVFIGRAAVAAPPVALGLIVQLRDAPAHEQLVREAALHAGGTGESRAAAEARRWQRVASVVASSTVRESVPRGVGRSARLLAFAQPLAAPEAQALAEQLRALPEVEWAVLDEREQRLQSTTPSDPMFGGMNGQWWLQMAGGSDGNTIQSRRRGVPDMQRAWSRNNGHAAAPVAVLDTGTTVHGELQDHLLPGFDLVSRADMANDGDGRDPDPADPGDWVSPDDHASASFAECSMGDSSWHGTVVAGLIAARTDDGAGVAAINWQGRVVPVRVAGKCGAAVSDIVDGMRWAAGLDVPDGHGGLLPRSVHPVRVINISFGGKAPCNAAYQSAIDELRALGVVVVAAAGNEHGAVLRPASCRGVVAVAALNRDGFKTHYSSFGPQVTLATVGGDDSGGTWGSLLTDHGLLTIANQGRTEPGQAGYARHAGTSFAAPLVAGTLSLMLSVNPSLGVDHLVAGLTVSARPHVRSPWIGECSFANPGRCLCTAATCGAGMLDAEQALIYASDPQAYAVPARQPELIDNPEVREAAALGADRPAQDAVVPEPASGGGAVDGGALLALLAALGVLSKTRGCATAARSARPAEAGPGALKAGSRRA